MNAKRQLQFDDTLSINEEIQHQKGNKLYPIMKKFANLLYVTKSTNNTTATVFDTVDDKKKEQEETADTYISYQDDLEADINKFCSEGHIEMDLDFD